LIERNQRQLSDRGKCSQIEIGPILGGWLSKTRHSPKAGFDFRGLVQEFDARIF
jgi:hypothetical protein